MSSVVERIDNLTAVPEQTGSLVPWAEGRNGSTVRKLSVKPKDKKKIIIITIILTIIALGFSCALRVHIGDALLHFWWRSLALSNGSHRLEVLQMSALFCELRNGGFYLKTGWGDHTWPWWPGRFKVQLRCWVCTAGLGSVGCRAVTVMSASKDLKYRSTTFHPTEEKPRNQRKGRTPLRTSSLLGQTFLPQEKWSISSQ